ncbi:MAG: transcription termination factor Rho [Ruminococcaceae bacterium]|nr:transcription termination factor Rho [Oscillospiraceae bacterium]
MDLEDLKKKKLEDLRAIAKMFGVKSVTTKNKAQLIEAMQAVAENDNSEEEPVEKTPEVVAVAASEQTAEIVSEEISKPATEEHPVAHAAKAPKQRNRNKASTRDDNQINVKDKQTTKKTNGKKQHVIKNTKHTNRRGKNTSVETDESAPIEDNKQSVASNVEELKENIDTTIENDTEKNMSDSQNEEADQVATVGQETPVAQSAPASSSVPTADDAEGILEVLPDGYGFLRCNRYISDSKDTYVPPTLIRKFNLKTGDYIIGKSKYQRENDKYQALCYINTVNGDTIDVAMRRKPFETLIPIYPDSKIKLETVQNELSTRIIDLIAPIGKGQRGMIVSPPKAGKTVLLKKIANSITENHPDIELIVLLIDERPEEVTDMRESVQGDVISSTFDEMPEKHIKVAEMVFERAQRLVEHGKDVVILMDSLTRLARAYNITIPPTGRSLSGGLDPGALYKPKRFFGAARNIRGGGSLTIIATALIDTGSKMDDVIFEEFKGTGNMELHLDRKLSEKRVFPAIDINKSGTRKEELLLTEEELSRVYSIRKALSNAATAEVTEMIVNKMLRTKNNEEFLKTINIITADK